MHLRAENACPECQGPKILLWFDAEFAGRSHTASVGTKLQQWLAAWGRIHLHLFFAVINFGVNFSLWTGQRNRLLLLELPVGHETIAQWHCESCESLAQETPAKRIYQRSYCCPLSHSHPYWQGLWRQGHFSSHTSAPLSFHFPNLPCVPPRSALSLPLQCEQVLGLCQPGHCLTTSSKAEHF